MAASLAYGLDEVRRRGRVLTALLPGLGLSAALGLAAVALARVVPLVGPAVIAVVLGLGVRLAFDPGRRVSAGVAFASRVVLQASIVLLGTGLALGTVVRVGAASLPVMLGTLAVGLVAGRLLGRSLAVPAPLRTLVTVGTAICGASAIAALATVVDVEAAEFAYAISTIFVFNIAAVLIFPAIGHALGLSQQAFGLWAGTAVNDTSSVVAAGYAYGHAAGAHAVVVKLTRTTLIVPIVLVQSVLARRRAGSGAEGSRAARARTIVPLFVILFVAAAGLNSLGLMDGFSQLSTRLALFLIAVALAAVGLSARPRQIAQTGARPLVLGAVLWLLVAGTSLVLQVLTGSA